MSPSRSSSHPTRTLAVLMIAAVTYSLAQTTLFPATFELMNHYDAGADAVAWTFTGYLLSAAVLTPLFGRLGDMHGKRRMLVLVLALFGAGSAVAALAGSLEGVVAGRVLQGAGGGIFPLCFGIARDELPAPRLRSGLGLIAATAGLGTGAGLLIGGLLVDYASFTWIFWSNALLAAIAAVAARLLVPESPRRSRGRVDLRGAAVFAVGLALPLIAISRAGAWGWTDPRTLGLTAVGLLVLAGWWQLEARTPDPMANVRTLGHRPVLMTNLATLLTGFGLFGSFLVIPQLAQTDPSAGYGFGASATTAALLLLPGALVMLLMAPVAGSIGARWGSRIPLALGGFISAFGLMALAIAHDSELAVLAFTTVLYAGVGLAFAAMPNLIVDAVPIAETGEAAGFNSVMRLVGASLGAQVSASIVAGTVVADGLPTAAGFQTAFLVSAGGALVAAAVSLCVPSAPARTASAAPAAAATAGGAAPDVT